MVKTSKTKRVNDTSRSNPVTVQRQARVPMLAPVPAPSRLGESGKTGSLTYTPAPGDPDVTVAFGKTFHAGKAVSVDDPKVFEKLSGNPNFSTGGKRKAGDRDDPDAKLLDKARDRAGEEAREARAEADEAVADAEARERAQQALVNLRDAETDPDRNPPLTNHPSNK